MKKTLVIVALVVAVILGIALPSAVSADVDAVDTYIHIEKQVSVDGGVTWWDADLAPGPIATVGHPVQFKVIVTNATTIGATHENVIVTDSDPSIVFTGVATTLLPGESDESDVVTVMAVAGQQYNEATVTADVWCGRVQDSNGAYYYGEGCGGEGLTPGYWKNHLSAWVGTGYSPTLDYFDDVFGVGPHLTLLRALEKGGGAFIALDRHAVAALLNANALDYPYTEEDVINMVQDAYATGDWSSAKDNLETANQLSDS